MSGPGARLLALARQAGARLAERRLVLACAESCTAGGVAYALTQVPGSSAWFERGWVVYSNQAKQDLLGVPEALLREHGAVSEPVARALALGALEHAPVQVALSVTGIAGPDGGTPQKPVGTVCFAWALRGAAGAPVRIDAGTWHFPGDRAAVRTQSIDCALSGLLRLLED
jgi:nicotinamide-nucleotide amidase